MPPLRLTTSGNMAPSLAGVKFIDENGGGLGSVRLRKRQLAKRPEIITPIGPGPVLIAVAGTVEEFIWGKVINYRYFDVDFAGLPFASPPISVQRGHKAV